MTIQINTYKPTKNHIDFSLFPIIAFNKHYNEYSLFYDDNTVETRYWTIGSTRRSNKYCIPYDDFKHLCNTSDEPQF